MEKGARQLMAWGKVWIAFLAYALSQSGVAGESLNDSMFYSLASVETTEVETPEKVRAQWIQNLRLSDELPVELLDTKLRLKETKRSGFENFVLHSNTAKNPLAFELGPLPKPDGSEGGGVFPLPGGGDNPLVVLDNIINLGLRIWEIIERNQAVVNVNYHYANGIPAGLDATDLESFSNLNFKSYRLRGKNWYGSVVFDVVYTVVHRYGGSYDGQGKFLDRVSVVPSRIVAKWGYTVDFEVTHVSVANVGSAKEPIASVALDTRLDIGTTFKKTYHRILFEFRGDSPAVTRYVP